ncbi:hypothetical protein AVEN_126860-1 [Araneus ventricosus]|uniref:Uncharacterized protein n=1 Tax=Araneus ventricosus TaxID=182803 RepID=A0A4Y2C2G8_ARAVE|nr:hypothetical protein AVEN_126860-1 [Araneus ventricosus]
MMHSSPPDSTYLTVEAINSRRETGVVLKFGENLLGSGVPSSSTSGLKLRCRPKQSSRCLLQNETLMQLEIKLEIRDYHVLNDFYSTRG